jgi:hypothetical protein
MGVENIVWGEDCILASPNPDKPAAAQGRMKTWARGEAKIPFTGQLERYSYIPINQVEPYEKRGLGGVRPLAWYYPLPGGAWWRRRMGGYPEYSTEAPVRVFGRYGEFLKQLHDAQYLPGLPRRLYFIRS